MCHQELHLVRQNAAVSQNEVFPQAGHIRRVQQRHTRLLRGAAAFAVVAGAAGSDNIHPGINTFLREGNDVFARQVFFMKMLAAVGTHIAVTHKELAIGQAGFEFKRVDFGHALGANNAVDGDDGLVTRHGVVATVKRGDMCAHLPANLV